MVEWVKRILWDESAFERYARALLMGAAIYLGQAGDLPGWAVSIGAALSVLIGAGEKNK